MKGAAKAGLSLVLISLIIGIFYFIQFALAPSIIWTTNGDWDRGTFTNTTNITGDLMLNNTIQNGTQTFYSCSTTAGRAAGR